MRKGLRRAIDKGFKKHILKPDQKRQRKKKEKDAPAEGDDKKKIKTIVVLPRMAKPGQPVKKRPWYTNPVVWILVSLVIGVFIFQRFQTPTLTEITLGEAVAHVRDNTAKDIKVDSSRVVLELEDGTQVYAVIPSKDGFRETLDQQNISQENVYYVEDTGSWMDIVSTIVYVAMLGGIIFFAVSLSKQMGKSGGGLLGMGKSRAKVLVGRKPKVGFKDVAGVDEAVEEINEIVEFLKKPQKFSRLGARIPKGVLIIGPPGTGKTLLARAIAGEAKVPFYFTSGSEFEEMLVGAGASRVRDLFEKAKKTAPSIIFIDEIDAVGRKRGTVLHTGTAEQTLNQILVEMDGFDRQTEVIIIGATNRPDVLDPALLRPGRFDRIIALDLPDIGARKAILNVHIADKPLAQDVDLGKIARRTVGFSGADLENVLNEAAILAARKEKKEITMEDVVEAITKVQLGPAKKRVQTDKEKKMIAYHEAGHAIVSHFMPESDEVLRVSIVSRGMSLGATERLPKEEHERIRTKSKLEADIACLVAGHVAEKVAFGETTTGAEDDIKKATRLARNMVTKYGMSELGPIEFGEGDDSSKFLGYDYSRKPFSEKTAADVDEQVAKLVDSAYQGAEEIIIKNRKGLDDIVEKLLEEETLDAKQFVEILEG